MESLEKRILEALEERSYDGGKKFAEHDADFYMKQIAQFIVDEYFLDMDKKIRCENREHPEFDD